MKFVEELRAFILCICKKERNEFYDKICRLKSKENFILT